MAQQPPRRELSEARIAGAIRLLTEFESQVVRLPAELHEALAGMESYCRTAISGFNARWERDAALRPVIERSYEFIAGVIEDLAIQLTEGTDDTSLPADFLPTIHDWLGREHAITLRTVGKPTYWTWTDKNPAEEIERRLGAGVAEPAWHPVFWTRFDVPRRFRRMTLRHLVLLGHEVAHAADVASGYRSEALAKDLDPEDPLREFVDILSHWISELVADVASVRRVGPAALVVMAEIAQGGPTDTHPVPELRLQLMADELEVLGYTGRLAELKPAVDTWLAEAREEATRNPPNSKHALILTKVRERLERIQGLARTLVPDDDCYKPARFEATAELVEDFVDGIARSDRYRDGRLAPESIVDLFNAAARVRVARLADLADLTNEKPGPSREVKALANLDRLLARAIEGIFLARAWSERAEATQTPEETRRERSETPSGAGTAVLSKAEIDERIRLPLRSPQDRERQIVVTPLIAPHVSAGGTLDVRLGRHFIAFRKTRMAGFDLLRQMRDLQREGVTDVEAIREELAIRFNRTVERIYVPMGDEFVLHPYQLVLAATLEYVALPADVGAHVLSRSSTGRLGILNATATYVHPGFTGVITLELVNTGETAVTVAPGMRIAQLLFVRSGETIRPRTGRYLLSTQPEISRLAIDEDLEVLAKFDPFGEGRPQPGRPGGPFRQLH